VQGLRLGTCDAPERGPARRGVAVPTISNDQEKLHGRRHDRHDRHDELRLVERNYRRDADEHQHVNDCANGHNKHDRLGHHVERRHDSRYDRHQRHDDRNGWNRNHRLDDLIRERNRCGGSSRRGTRY
jgi:hypothetical protein